MELYIKNPDDYMDSGMIDSEIETAIKKIENIKDNVSSSYNNLHSRTRRKVNTFNVANYDQAIESLANLNNRRKRFANNMAQSTENIEGLLDAQDRYLSFSYEKNAEEVKLLLSFGGHDSSIVDGVSEEVLQNYRPENAETYKQLITMYSKYGPLTSGDVEQIIRAGNCARFNQNSQAGLNLYFSGNPYAVPSYGTSNPRRGIKNGGKTYASCSSSGCGPSTIRNIAGSFFPEGTITVIDTVKATSDLCQQNEINFNKIGEVCATVGLQATNLNLISGNRLDYDDVKTMEAIDNGELVILSKRLDSGGGHYVAVVGYKKINDQHVEFLYLDPFNSDSSGNATFSFSSNTRINRGGYSIKPMENGVEIASQYHNQNAANFETDAKNWHESFGQDTIYL